MARAHDPVLARLAATEIVRTLRRAGHEAYFAGGCVRDALLGLQPTDFDVATDAPPAIVRSLFRSTDEVGAAFGVVLVHQRAGTGPGGGGGERVTVEVATFRSDGPYSDSRRPDTVHFSDARSDAARRDFTINAMFLDPLADGPAPGGGRIIDFVGGLADVRARVIRAVGDPDRRLAEDHLRALRAVRFAARFDFAIEPATHAAIRRHAAELRGVSRERIGEELRRMLGHPTFARSIDLLRELGLDAPVLNDAPAPIPGSGSAGVPVPARDPAGPSAVRGLSADARGVPTPMLALAAWVLDRSNATVTGLGSQSVTEVRRRIRAALCLSNDESDELAAVLSMHQQIARAWSEATVALRKRWAVAGTFEPALRLVGAVDPALAEAVRNEVARLSSDGIGLAPEPLIDGDTLTECGLTPGPAFARILNEVYDAQLEGRVRTREAATELARRLYV